MIWFWIHLFLTLYMVGLIWFVQVVHYPLMRVVPADTWLEYEQKHTLRTGWVTAPPMVGELATGVLLFWMMDLPVWVGWLNLISILSLWASTFFIQVPLHSRLSREYHSESIHQLVRTNWLRTFVWTLRGVGLSVLAWSLVG
jgi:hypothetical protein